MMANMGTAWLGFPATTTMIAFTCDLCVDGIYEAYVYSAACAAVTTTTTPIGFSGAFAVEAIEPTITCSSGACSGSDWNDWVPTVAELAAGASLVVHNGGMADPMMLCADLARTEQGTYSGILDFLTAFETANFGDFVDAITDASVWLRKPELASMISFSGAGFPNGAYEAGLYTETCTGLAPGTRFNGGDGVTSDAVNEVQIDVICTNGMCMGSTWNDFDFPMMMGVGSVVVYNGALVKMLCGDVVYADGEHTATVDYLPAYTAAIALGTFPDFGPVAGSPSAIAASAKSAKSSSSSAKSAKIISADTIARKRRDAKHLATHFTASFGTAPAAHDHHADHDHSAAAPSAKMAKVAVSADEPLVFELGASTRGSANGRSNNKGPYFAVGGFAAAMVVAVGMYTYQKNRPTYVVVDEATPLAKMAGVATSNTYGASA
jgi:hypothetical protein